MSDEMRTTATISDGQIEWTQGEEGETFGFFSVYIPMQLTHETGGYEAQSTVLFHVPVFPKNGRETPYAEVEFEAARSLPKALRDAADQIEEQVEASAQLRLVALAMRTRDE
ncbi:hypothetical protein LX81_00256 [Palleronia aestuarii]|uniref:Uncharacterized protein n=1 Tax=Palleronia aestuarii TaxID=568105 RepID=A0A2W7NT62_9RHOB|nr:hypothetical protein [Palleronia aestuarii]PZX19794.1 hypothetical protein LX81_00256 [Palleronia aestuarii]